MIHDKQGNVGTFANYQATLFGMDKFIVGKAMGQTTEEQREKLRHQLVKSAQVGATLVLDFGNATSSDILKDLNSSELPLNCIFECKEWRKKENYKRIVKPDEDHGLPPNEHVTDYEMKDNFNLVVLFSGEDSARADMEARIDHHD